MFVELFIGVAQEMVLETFPNVGISVEDDRTEIFVGRNNNEILIVGQGFEKTKLRRGQVAWGSSAFEEGLKCVFKGVEAMADFRGCVDDVGVPVGAAKVELTGGPGGGKAEVAHLDFCV